MVTLLYSIKKLQLNEWFILYQKYFKIVTILIGIQKILSLIILSTVLSEHPGTSGDLLYFLVAGLQLCFSFYFRLQDPSIRAQKLHGTEHEAETRSAAPDQPHSFHPGCNVCVVLVV